MTRDLEFASIVVWKEHQTRAVYEVALHHLKKYLICFSKHAEEGGVLLLGISLGLEQVQLQLQLLNQI